METASGTTRNRRVAHGHGREALCRALVRIVARDGLRRVTFRSVAAEAGVTHGLATYHFRTREAMISEALSWAVRHAIDESRIAHEAADLSDFAAALPVLIHDRPEDAIFMDELVLQSLRRPELLADVQAMYERFIDAVRGSLVRFGISDDPAVARVVFAALDGLVKQQLIYRDPARTGAALAALRRLLASTAPPVGEPLPAARAQNAHE